MYSWNTVRTFCAVLLVLPLIHLAYLVSQETLASLDASSDVWADEVEAYSRLDQAMELPLDPVVVVGGRAVKLWNGLEDALAPRPVLMRGLGDATVDDVTYYYTKLVGFYRPETVVLLPGNSEFHVRDNKFPQELVERIAGLAELTLSYGVTRRFIVFVPVKNPANPGDHAKIDQIAVLLAQWAASEEAVTVIDANRLLADRERRPNPDFFRLDGVNLNDQGYLRLTLLLTDRLGPMDGESSAGPG